MKSDSYYYKSWSQSDKSQCYYADIEICSTSQNYESVTESNKSRYYYADIEIYSAVRPGKIESVEENLFEVTLFDDHPYKESLSERAWV